MIRSRRLYRAAVRHGFITALALMFCVAAAIWMLVAILYGTGFWAIVAGCVITLAAFVAQVEGTETFRLYDLHKEEALRELREANTFPVKPSDYPSQP